MSFNPPSSTRMLIYAIQAFANGVLASLAVSGVEIPVIATALAGGINALVAFMAGSNITGDE